MQSHQVREGHTKAPSHRCRPLHALFVHRDAETIEKCLEELKKAQFAVSSDSVLNVPQCTEQLKTLSYEVIVVEQAALNGKGSGALQTLHQNGKGTPIILLTTSRWKQEFVELTADVVCEYVEQEHITQLPITVRRALNERKLREELEDARKALRHSQSLYRALVDNPAYGIYRCDAEGELLDINGALTSMFGYASKEQFLAANRESPIIPKFGEGSPFPALSPELRQIRPVEIEWKRKDGTTLKVRLSGRGVFDDQGNFAGHEIIAVDVTEQRTLEDQLRHQASTDSLTGLANHRRLFEVLHSEICRSKRTGREFSLLLLDLDGLKKLNDAYGHLVGDRALCRLSQVVADCSRSIDTAARQGGDEFALILPETGLAAATSVARRICDLIQKDAEHPALSVSVGAASYPKDAQTIGTLLYAADRALYEMKAAAQRSTQISSSTTLPLYDKEGSVAHG
jgi:diguanylate cyclase (GGDEF)-like protein/PAS domain S-box-containing protein